MANYEHSLSMKIVLALLSFFLCASVYAEDEFLLRMGREEGGVIEVFSITKDKARDVSEVEPKKDFFRIMSVDVLQISREWVRNNLGQGFKVEYLNVAHQDYEGLRVWYYFVTVNNFDLHPVNTDKRIRKSIVVLSNREVILGKKENSSEFYKRIRGG